eukprot:104851-Pelagomonas_calceolata.AAC.10
MPVWHPTWQTYACTPVKHTVHHTPLSAAHSAPHSLCQQRRTAAGQALLHRTHASMAFATACRGECGPRGREGTPIQALQGRHFSQPGHPNLGTSG